MYFKKIPYNIYFYRNLLINFSVFAKFLIRSIIVERVEHGKLHSYFVVFLKILV